MRTITLTVGADDRGEIPDTRPGQTVTIQLEAADASYTAPRDWLKSDHDGLLHDETGLPR